MAKRKITPEELPSNSIAATRQNRVVDEGKALVVKNVEVKRPRRAAKTRAVVRKKTFAQSIAEAIVGDSHEIGGYIANDVLIPAFKNTIQEMVTSGIEMLLFGERKSSRSRDRDRGATKVSYGSYYKDRDRSDRYERPRPAYRDKFNLGEIYFKDGRDADDVLQNLCDALEEYEEVSVREYFDLAGIEGAGWTHDKYGWRDLRDARCTHTRYGYSIILPDPIELD